MTHTEESQRGGHQRPATHSSNTDNNPDEKSGDRGGHFNAVSSPEAGGQKMTANGDGQTTILRPEVG